MDLSIEMIRRIRLLPSLAHSLPMHPAHACMSQLSGLEGWVAGWQDVYRLAEIVVDRTLGEFNDDGGCSLNNGGGEGGGPAAETVMASGMMPGGAAAGRSRM